MKDSAVQRLRTALNELQIVLRAELSQLDTYFVSQVSIFSTRDLVDNTEELFTSDVRAYLSDRARHDIRQAGKCLAFGLHDAAAFHVLKATEEVMRAYAELLSGRPLEVRSRSWGDYIRILRDAGADSKIAEYLDYIRKNHRNPILHPDAHLTKDESVALFNAATNAIVPMVQAALRKK